jgi:hypothetical protein
MTTLPDTANVGDPGHVADHNLITAALAYPLSVNVKSYGAAGDGVTDDTAAVQAAVAAAAGGSVFFPAGIYLTSNAISIPDDTTFYGTGPGSIVKSNVQPNGGTGIGQRQIDSSSATGWTIRDMAFDMSGITTFLAGLRVINAVSSSGYRVEGCKFTSPGGAIASIGCSDYWIVNNTYTWSATDAASHSDAVWDQWSGSHGFYIAGNAADCGSVMPYGVLITGETTANTAAACYEFTVEGNKVRNAKDVGIWSNGRKGVNYDFTVSSNTVTTVPNYYGIAVSDATQFTVSGNVVVDTEYCGMRFYSETGAGGTTGCVGATVTGNVVVNANLAGSVSSDIGAAISVVANSDGCTINGNRVVGTGHVTEVNIGGSTTNCADVGRYRYLTVTGSRGGNVALASLLTQLATLGLITDSSS